MITNSNRPTLLLHHCYHHLLVEICRSISGLSPFKTLTARTAVHVDVSYALPAPQV